MPLHKVNACKGKKWTGLWCESGTEEAVGGWMYYGRDRASVDRPQSAAQIKAHSVPSVHSSQASEITPTPTFV
ncbi:unnamed protein product [Arctogadus glacialis]